MSLEQRMQLLERDANRTGDALDQLRAEMNQRFDGVEQRLDRLEQRFGGLEQRFTDLERDVSQMLSMLARIVPTEN